MSTSRSYTKCLKSTCEIVTVRDRKITPRKIAPWKIAPQQIPFWVRARVWVRDRIGGNFPGGNFPQSSGGALSKICS